MQRFLGLGVVLAVAVIIGVVLLVNFSGSSYVSKNDPEKGVCHFKFVDENNEEVARGCGGVKTQNICEDITIRGGAVFISFDSNANANELGCYSGKGLHMLVDSYNIRHSAKEVSFPVRIIPTNERHRFFSNNNILICFIPVVYFFFASFLILVYLKKNYNAISYPFILLVSIIFGSVAYVLSESSSTFQLYFEIGKHVYLISNLLFLSVLTYLLLYMIFTPIYHMTKFHKGQVTPLMLSFIVLTDKFKNKFNL